MVVKATLFDLRIAEIPTVLSPDGRYRPPHLRTWRDGWRYLRFLLLLQPAMAVSLSRDIALFLFGIAVTLWLLPRPRTIGAATFDYHTLLFGAMSILIGFQSINFALFTKFFAITEHFAAGRSAPEQGLPVRDPRDRLDSWRALDLGRRRHMGLRPQLLAKPPFRRARSRQDASDRHSRVRGVDFGKLQIVLSSFFVSVLGMGRR